MHARARRQGVLGPRPQAKPARRGSIRAGDGGSYAGAAAGRGKIIGERADAAIKDPAEAPPLIEALLRGGLDRSPDDWIDARAAVQWAVWTKAREIGLLRKIAASLGVND